jgi:hypothetical protein
MDEEQFQEYQQYIQNMMGTQNPDVFDSVSGFNSAVTGLRPTSVTIQQQRKAPVPDEAFQMISGRETQGLKAQREGVKAFEQLMQERAGAGDVTQTQQVLAGISDLFNNTQNLEKLNARKSTKAQDDLKYRLALQGMKKDLTGAETDFMKSQYQHEMSGEKVQAMRDIANKKAQPQKDEKLLTATETAQLADLKTQLGSVDSLYADWKTKVGGVGGTADYLGNILKSNIPNTELSKYNDNLKQKAQLIGKALEGGKLTDVDYTKYVKFLPQVGDTEERAQSRIENLREEFHSAYSNKIKTFGEAGYKTSGFSGVSEQAGTAPGSTKEQRRKQYEALLKKEKGE